MNPNNRTFWPTIADVAQELRNAKSMLDRGDEMEVRLQVYQDGGWALRKGDPSYDLDHNGYWGCGYITRRTNCRDLARDLIAEAMDHASQVS